jgi:hypothetical protein
VTRQAAPLAAGNEHTTIAPHHNSIPKMLRARREVRPAARSLVAQRPHTADVRKGQQQTDEKADQEREARLAALQTADPCR